VGAVERSGMLRVFLLAADLVGRFRSRFRVSWPADPRRVAQAGGPAFSEGFELGAPSFPVLVYGKGGVLRPRFRLCFLYLLQTFTLVSIIK
jgi:hypothetical protein